MDKTFGFFFHLKKSKFDRNGEIPIYLRLTVDRETCEISVKRKCSSSKWNVSAGRVSGWSENEKSINSYLELLQNHFIGHAFCTKQCREKNANKSSSIRSGKLCAVLSYPTSYHW